MKDRKEYLGDGVYATYDGWNVRLDANSPTNPSDTIWLDPGTRDNLDDYLRRVRAWREEAAKKADVLLEPNS